MAINSPKHIIQDICKSLVVSPKPLVMEVMDSDQIAFLPLMCILDNVLLLAHETIDWGKAYQTTLSLFETRLCKGLWQSVLYSTFMLVGMHCTFWNGSFALWKQWFYCDKKYFMSIHHPLAWCNGNLLTRSWSASVVLPHHPNLHENSLQHW